MSRFCFSGMQYKLAMTHKFSKQDIEASSGELLLNSTQKFKLWQLIAGGVDPKNTLRSSHNKP